MRRAEIGELAFAPETEVANMHCHTFYSFNAYGYSPSGLASLARRRGYKLLGIVDFDVLDGVEEFLGACEQLGVRGSAGLETRVFIPEFANREINSPGEPGISYHMGLGFTASRVPDEVAPILAGMRRRAEARNRDMLARLNVYLAPVTVDYERDVLPLTPNGNATERHMLAAWVRAAGEQCDNPARFWGEKLGLPEDQVGMQMNDAPGFHNLLRSRLMKRGRVGYVEPCAEAFPAVEEVNELTVACGALPCAAWLDGLSAGEQAMDELLELLISKGVLVLNIIPDRNWNVADGETRRVKVQKLVEVVELARMLDLPLNVGTEMNAYGQKLIDEFDATELAPVREAFLDGAYFIYGHTVLQRALGLGYQSEWARTRFPLRRERNAFYTQAGRQIPPGVEGLARLHRLGPSSSPDEILRLGKVGRGIGSSV